jgi:transposase InsO family protein
MIFDFIDNHKRLFPIEKMCKVLKVSKSGFYKNIQKRKFREMRRKKEEELSIDIRNIFKNSKKTYGSPRIYEELKRKGKTVGHNKVAYIMKQQGFFARPKKKYKKTTDSNHGERYAANIVNRDFYPKKPDLIWASDITYIRTYQGWLYYCPIMDLFNAEIIGWSFSTSLDSSFVKDALIMAQINKKVDAIVFHSDRGIQYCSKLIKEYEENNNIVPSMSRKGNCWDNARLESFFATLKKEEVYRNVYTTIAEAKSRIFEYTETFYNRQRLHSTLGYKSPVEFREEYFSLQNVHFSG